MKIRYLSAAVHELCFSDHKMAFVSGARQSGKTTMAKMLMARRAVSRYFNWDDSRFRRLWARNPNAAIPVGSVRSVPMLVLDEIHKHYRWKRSLKGVYDTLTKPCDILVTGSARLNIYRRRSDSLLGRYHHFRLHPFSIREMHEPKASRPAGLIEEIFSGSTGKDKTSQTILEAMMRFGPFPEPLLSENSRKARLWRRERRDLVIREDLRDISHLPELDRVEMMAALLPERVGSPLSLNSLREDLDAGHHTVRRWLTYLKEVYYLYELKPYHKSIPRALRKEGKIYFWDFGEVEDPAARFENLVASHLLKACHYWTDTGESAFDLHYLRNKEKQEIDFLIVKDNRPWLPVEVKSDDTEPSPHWKKFMPLLGCSRGLQLVRKPHWRIHNMKDFKVLVAGAAQALKHFV